MVKRQGMLWETACLAFEPNNEIIEKVVGPFVEKSKSKS